MRLPCTFVIVIIHTTLFVSLFIDASTPLIKFQRKQKEDEKPHKNLEYTFVGDQHVIKTEGASLRQVMLLMYRVVFL